VTVLLLPTKLAMPRPSHGWVHRARLADLLTDRSGARLVLVSAPPGFGKTTALVDWLRTSNVRCSWLALDAADNDPGRFLRYLWSAASALAGSPAADPTGAGHTGNADDVVDEICRLLVEQTSRAVLVLDDYHHISARPIRHAVGLLLDRLPQGVQLVISTRHDPALPLARLRAQGELLEIRAEDLRFTSDEAMAFLTTGLGVALGDDDLEMLMARTEGWPAVLQLAGLSLAGRSDVTRRVRAFAASHRHVLDYVTDEVLAGLDRPSM
jgi:ATP/maltotriose-dependent transcriptional regulator MalT